MSEQVFLKRLFQAYYRNIGQDIACVAQFGSREFGFIPWDRQIMIRHMGFDTTALLSKYLIQEGPRHVYSSGTIYKNPDRSEMDNKGYLGCDFIIDIDVDHFYTPCKENHDFWYCRDCGKQGKGMAGKKCSCGSTRFKTFSWICEQCLEVAKRSIISLVDDFLIPDFGLEESELKIAFSGHRGYHIKVENEKMRALSSEGRREIADYLSGNNLSLDILGFKEKSGVFYGLRKENVGWACKIATRLEKILNEPLELLENTLTRLGLKSNVVTNIINSRIKLLNTFSSTSTANIWDVEGLGRESWVKFLQAIAHEIGVEIDEPVTIDVHRLIRYPDSLHGKSGFKVQELTRDQLDWFNPLNEQSEELDPIVFYSSSETQKLQIIETTVPPTTMKDQTYGPYSQGDVIEVPNHLAVFLLCKEVAKLS
ncbi:MAG: hypothetical protein JW891_08205 [Candidatus Lokiarchaeota archaeon]|nr:hypothetical protein [Candidatus Lokiarchaeota archaeon]